MNTETSVQESQAKNVRGKREVTDISSMLLPLENKFLLLPGVAVAEIVTYVAPEAEYDETTPNWYLGTIHWRNQRVPMVCYESMTTGSEPLVSGQCRIAVLNNTGQNQQLNFFAVLLQATPKLLRLSSDDITLNHEKMIDEGEKMHVVVLGDEAVIPDVSYIEKKIIEHLQLS